jgi:toxin FitB
MYLLDTNVVSELRKKQPHGAVLAWLGSVDDRDLRISAVTLGEFQEGIEITRDQDPEKAAEIESWVDQIAATWNVLPIDRRIFRLWARLMHRRSDTLSEDAMIAATAIVHDLTLATRNVKDFRDFGIALLNPYTTPRTAR